LKTNRSCCNSASFEPPPPLMLLWTDSKAMGPFDMDEAKKNRLASLHSRLRSIAVEEPPVSQTSLRGNAHLRNALCCHVAANASITAEETRYMSPEPTVYSPEGQRGYSTPEAQAAAARIRQGVRHFSPAPSAACSFHHVARDPPFCDLILRKAHNASRAFVAARWHRAGIRRLLEPNVAHNAVAAAYHGGAQCDLACGE